MTEYATMDGVVYKDLMKRFREPPGMDAPIDKYFRKQQECQLRSQDSDDPITDKGMVIQLTTSLGETGLINNTIHFRKVGKIIILPRQFNHLGVFIRQRLMPEQRCSKNRVRDCLSDLSWALKTLGTLLLLIAG